MNKIVKSFYNSFRYLKFIFRLIKLGVFTNTVPESILIILKEFILSEYKLYKKKIIMSRDAEKSTQLISALIDSYIETKSNTTLEQITEVLKQEFIKRGS